MHSNSNTRLKSTGEPVIILIDDGADPSRGSAGSGYTLCLLPPQSPGHKPRMQWIRGQVLIAGRR